MKFGSKKAIFGVIWGGLDLVWETATPLTHIWERFPQKKRCFFWQLPLSLKNALIKAGHPDTKLQVADQVSNSKVHQFLRKIYEVDNVGEEDPPRLFLLFFSPSEH